MAGHVSFLNTIRLLRARLGGAHIGRGVVLGRNLSLKGQIVIGEDVCIGDDVVLAGEIQIDAKASIQKQVEVTGNISIGANTSIGAFSYLSTMPQGRLKIGADVLVNAYSIIGASNAVEIGDHCIFAAYVQITDATHGIDDPSKLTKHTDFASSPVTLGKNVWLGSSAMISMGVTIGEGSVIGAKSLVMKSIPPFSVAYGIPARVVRNRLQEAENKG